MEAEKAFVLTEGDSESHVDKKASSGEDTVPPQKKRKVSVFFRYHTKLSYVYTGVQRTKLPLKEAEVRASGSKRKAASSKAKTTGSQNKRVSIQAPCSIFIFGKIYVFAIFCR